MTREYGAGAHVLMDLATSPQKSHLGLCRVRTRRGSKAGREYPAGEQPARRPRWEAPAPEKGGDEPTGTEE